jgi:hypothetical protein
MQNSRPSALTHTVFGVAAHCAGVVVIPRSMSATDTVCARVGCETPSKSTTACKSLTARMASRLDLRMRTIGSEQPLPHLVAVGGGRVQRLRHTGMLNNVRRREWIAIVHHAGEFAGRRP